MEEEISLREIIYILWQGKWVITIITIVALLISILYSFILAAPVYSGDVKVSVNNVSSVPETVQPVIDELTKPEIFEQTMKSSNVLGKVIEEAQLDLSIEQLQSKLEVELPEGETDNFIVISLKGEDRDQIKSVVDHAITLTKEEMKVNFRSRLTLLEEEYQLNMEQENKNINEAVQDFNDIQAAEGLPALLLFQQNNSDGQYIIEINEEILNKFNDLDKMEQVNYEKINSEIENLTSLYGFYSNKYDEIRSVSMLNIVDISINVLSDTYVPNDPISPNKLLNIAITLVLGLMIGVGVVFFRDYLKEDTSKKTKEI
ncbi:Wzz/FepE/Etk N-terminal domain-containing protein [Paraliobacillus sediminis]|uniref:Wzz/FepE/Etk N-terminal domain-containing protein n=1 Tax=Paraliobacillus sediminis TaxID=1885916 RepID=UPI000E3C7BB0|nr:Wzz/FepE/Etk N-terminal domain-containing protein [Paraliobacillus sediminis]